MFKFSLENGKFQLVDGLRALIANIIIAVIWMILAFTVPNNIAQTVFTVIFGITCGVLLIVSSIKIIFGAVVYHAERTSARNTKDIVKDNVEWVRLDDDVTTISGEKLKTARQTRSPIVKVIHYKGADAAQFVMEDGNRYMIYDVNDKIAQWQKISKTELTKLFYDKLIKDAKLD